MIKVLDCTLRDGGYINNWEFGFDNIKQIINSLSKSNLDYIECGFLKNTDYSVTEICFASGFGSISHFNASFKSNTGMTPMQFRKKHGDAWL